MLRYILSSFAALVMVLTNVGCTQAYFSNVTSDSLEVIRLKSSHRVDRSASWIVHNTTPVFLGRPMDMKNEDRRRNMLKLYGALHISLQQAFPAYATVNETLSLPEALKRAQVTGSELLFWPKLVNSENKLNTNVELLEGKSLHPDSRYGPDEIMYQVLIYEVRTQHLIDASTVFSRGRMFAGDESLPQDLFENAAIEYVFEITGKPVG